MNKYLLIVVCPLLSPCTLLSPTCWRIASANPPYGLRAGLNVACPQFNCNSIVAYSGFIKIAETLGLEVTGRNIKNTVSDKDSLG